MIPMCLRARLGGGVCVCVSAYTNVLKGTVGGSGGGGREKNLDCAPFNSFIDDNLLVDLSLFSRRFTWHKGDDHSMIRLHRYLLFEDWGLKLMNCI